MSQKNELGVEQLPAYMYDRIYKKNTDVKLTSNEEHKQDKEEYNLNKIICEKEIEIIKKVMSMAGGNKTKAAKMLGIPRQTLKYKIDKYKLN